MIDFDKVVADTRTLIGIESTNPGVLEAQCADWVEQRLRGMGLEPKRHPVQDGRDNLSVTIAGKDPTAPRLVFVSHLDTVPIGVGWTRDPLGGEIEHGFQGNHRIPIFTFADNPRPHRVVQFWPSVAHCVQVPFVADET